MPKNLYQVLHEQNLISDKLHQTLDDIHTRKTVSLFTELRVVLYLAVLMLSSGLSLLIYKNIGQMGHYLALFALVFLFAGSLILIVKKSFSFSKEKVASPKVYFDYLLLFVGLLWLIIQAYLQFLFNYLDFFASGAALLSSLFFFFLAYRYDHLGLLFMAITAAAAFLGISIPHANWYSLSIFESNLFESFSMIFSVALITTGLLLDKLNIKKHFTFSYVNIGSFLFLATTCKGLFNENNTSLYLALLILGAAAAIFYAIKTKSFSMLIYSYLFGYIGLTYLLSFIAPDSVEFIAFYFMISSAASIAVVIHFRKFLSKN